MKLLDNSERLKILIALSDQLWEDFKYGQLTKDQYLHKADEVRSKINRISDETFLDLQNLSSSLGYILIKKTNVFGSLNDYIITRN